MEPIDPVKADRILWELRPAYEAMMEEQDDIRWLEQAAQKEMRRVAAERYPSLANWDSDLMKKLSSRIYRAAEQFALDTSNIAYEAEQRMTKGGSGATQELTHL